jgi:hypothetical protein
MFGTQAIPDWPRQHFQAGGNDPFLLYVIFGANVRDLNISRSRYRCAGVPEGVDLLAYGPEQHPEVLDSFRQGYVWDEFKAKQPESAAAIETQSECVVLRGSGADSVSLNYFRDSIGVLTCLLDQGGVAIYDPQGLVWWAPDDWKGRVFEPARMTPTEHVAILLSQEADGTLWFHTRGLRKFGRPDLSMHHAEPRHQDAVVEMFNRFIEYQAFGGRIPEGQKVRMNSLPDDLVCIHGGHEDDPDFNNIHVEIKRPSVDLFRARTTFVD